PAAPCAAGDRPEAARPAVRAQNRPARAVASRRPGAPSAGHAGYAPAVRELPGRRCGAPSVSKIRANAPAPSTHESMFHNIDSMREYRRHMLLLTARQRYLVESLTAGRDRLWQQLQRARANAIKARLRAIGLRHRAIAQRLIFGDGNGLAAVPGK